MNGHQVRFVGEGKEKIYAWVEKVLVEQEYAAQGKKRRGVVRAYLAKLTGKSLPQITRLIRKYAKTGQVRATAYRRRWFGKVYTDGDVALLAKVDRAHARLSGPATRRILEREYGEYGQAQYARLGEISVAHLYNLRQRPDYRKQAASYRCCRRSLARHRRQRGGASRGSRGKNAAALPGATPGAGTGTSPL
ncbi:MAG TPA: hypothetical protein VN924_10365 [Bryobacteraceae bacterium]|nr:hypothetical protein [Bryobacteraceae bacterium]